MVSRTETISGEYLKPGSEVHIFHICGDRVLVWHRYTKTPTGEIVWLPLNDVKIPDDYEEEGYCPPPKMANIKLAAVDGHVVTDNIIPLKKKEYAKKWKTRHFVLTVLSILAGILFYVGFMSESGQAVMRMMMV